MIAFLRARRCRLPLAALLLVVTQLAFAGQACRAVMVDVNGADAADAMHQPGAVSDTAAQAADGDEHGCCGDDAPPIGICLVAIDGSTAAALVSGSTAWPDIAVATGVASSEPFRRPDTPLPTRAAASAHPLLPVYIVYHRFLS